MVLVIQLLLIADFEVIIVAKQDFIIILAAV
jgi:hypothetical protein